jgi:hypothetical protein
MLCSVSVATVGAAFCLSGTHGTHRLGRGAAKGEMGGDRIAQAGINIDRFGHYRHENDWTDQRLP